eukprot:TRINITY_DN4052_c0_g1_i1.p1 TRINITY_DN4052_c0_g1~~TRINITY_DN4052_c0_g1_i1.p1  ORF type:complete len:633 (+),score=103.05 TRINITY_DN4052_c0_g1_i1:134-2032(+)
MALKTIIILSLCVAWLNSLGSLAQMTVDLVSSDDGYVGVGLPDYVERGDFPYLIKVKSTDASDPYPDYIYYGFVGWDFPADRTNWQVTNATLTIYFQNGLIASGATMTLGLCALTTNTWDSNTFTWNSMVAFHTNYTVITSKTVPVFVTNGKMVFSLTSALAAWLPANPSPARLTLILFANGHEETQFASRRSPSAPGPTLSLTGTNLSLPSSPTPAATPTTVTIPTTNSPAPVTTPTNSPSPTTTPTTSPSETTSPVVAHSPVSSAPTVFTPVTEQIVDQTSSNNTAPPPTEALAIGLGVSMSVVGATAIFLGVFFGLKKMQKNKKQMIAEEPQGPGPNDTIYEAVPMSSISLSGSPNVSNSKTEIFNWQIKRDKEIGSGNYGKVYIARFNNAKVAVKYYHQIEALQDFQHEADLFCKMKPHPNIVQLIGICIDGTQPAIVLEYCNGGSLEKYLKNNPLLSLDEKIKLMYGTACGICHLHINDIVHRDLAARNILMNRGQPKISDFGMSRFVTSHEKMGHTKTNIGPVKWMAPESIASQMYSPKSDVWMFANVCYEILTNKMPFENEDIFTVAVDVRDEGRHPELPEGTDSRLVEILEKCWSRDANDRPSMDTVIEEFEQKFDFVGESESD